MMKNTLKFAAKSASILIALALVIGGTPSYASLLSANGSASSVAFTAKKNDKGKAEEVKENKANKNPVETGDNPETSTEGNTSTEETQNSKKPDSSPGKPTTSNGSANSKTEPSVKTVDVKNEKTKAKIKASGERVSKAKVNGKKPAPGETANFIIVYKAGTDLDAESAALAKIKAPQGKRFSGVIPAFATKLNAEQIEKLQSNPSVAFIEEDFKISLVEPSSDFVIANQASAPWGLDRIDSPNLPRDNLYTYTSTGTGVTAYVVDTGIRSTHVDFTSRVAQGFSAISDANGTTDCNGHGTHVAGTIGGSTYGVAKTVSLVPVRVLDCEGSGYLSGVIAGLDWIGNNYVAGTAAVVNMSLGGGASSALDSAVNSLISKGVVVVVAAGNSSADACTSSPARVPSAITVAASTSTDTFASYSNFGSCVDLVAPGSSVVSAWVTSDTSAATASGTSMASPHVAGTIALYLSSGYKDPGVIQATLLQKATKNKITSIKTGTPNLLVHTDPLNSVPSSDATAPEVPTSVQATAAARRFASGSWVLPEAVEGAPLTSVTVRLFESNGRLLSTTKLAGSATSISYRNLKQGTSYYLEVSVANAIGSSGSVRSNTITALR